MLDRKLFPDKNLYRKIYKINKTMFDREQTHGQLDRLTMFVFLWTKKKPLVSDSRNNDWVFLLSSHVRKRNLNWRGKEYQFYVTRASCYDSYDECSKRWNSMIKLFPKHIWRSLEFLFEAIVKDIVENY